MSQSRVAIEEEIFGNVETADSNGWWAFLVPAGNLPTGATDSVPVGFGDHLETPRDWGWFEVGVLGSGCYGGVADSAEIHLLDGKPTPGVLETHCVEVGTSFTLDLERSDTLQSRREIDWESWNLVQWDTHKIWVDDDNAGGGGHWYDLWAHFDQTGGTDTVVPAVEITATQSALVASWDPLHAHTDGKYHIPSNFVVRVGAWPTTMSGIVDEHMKILVRYFWHYGSTHERTGFISLADAGQEFGLVRTRQYGGTAPYDRTVRAHFVLPHQVPSPVSDTTATDYGKTLDLSLRIDSAFTAVISVDDTVIVGDAVAFTDTGLDGAGIDSLTWDFGDGSDTTAAAPTHVFDTTGSMTVVLRKYNVYDGIVYEDTTLVVVLPELNAGVIVGSYDGWPTNNDIEEDDDCMWEVTPTGGTGSYTYVWQRQKRFWATITGDQYDGLCWGPSVHHPEVMRVAESLAAQPALEAARRAGDEAPIGQRVSMPVRGRITLCPGRLHACSSSANRWAARRHAPSSSWWPYEAQRPKPSAPVRRRDRTRRTPATARVHVFDEVVLRGR